MRKAAIFTTLLVGVVAVEVALMAGWCLGSRVSCTIDDAIDMPLRPRSKMAQAIPEEQADVPEDVYEQEPSNDGQPVHGTVAYTPSYGPVTAETSAGGAIDDFRSMGVVYQDGTRYTWYSQNVLPGNGLDELNGNGRHVEDGYVKDGDGYIAVASSDHEIGTVVDTPFGPGKVYDTGCDAGTIDIYTDF